MSVATVEAEDLVVDLGRRRILDGVTVSIPAGVTVVLGGNGTGKTTLLRAVVGLIPHTSGTIRVAGHPVENGGLSRSQGSAVGYLPQEPHLVRTVSVRDALLYSQWLHASTRRRDEQVDGSAPDVESLAALLGIDHVLDEQIGRLSGGTRRLAMFGCAVVHDPAVVVLDEPTAGVDVEHRARLRQFLHSRRERCAVVMSSHLADDLEHLADRVIVLDGGVIVYQGSPDDLLGLGVSRRPHESALDAALRAVREPRPVR